MAEITRAATASVDASTAMFAAQISGKLAGEALVIGPGYIKVSDGKVYQSDGSANDAAAKVHGFVPHACAAGEPVTLYGPGTRFGYGSSLAIGPLYLGATAGSLDTAATTGGLVPIALSIDGKDIVVVALVP
jgi:hypothetical protein